MIKTVLVLPYNEDLASFGHGSAQRNCLAATQPACLQPSRLRHTQHHFADVLAAVNIAVGCSGLFERKRLADDRLDFAGVVEPEEFIQFLRQDRAASLSWPRCTPIMAVLSDMSFRGWKRRVAT